jgi:hypothetical protein
MDEMFERYTQYYFFIKIKIFPLKIVNEFSHQLALKATIKFKQKLLVLANA